MSELKVGDRVTVSGVVKEARSDGSIKLILDGGSGYKYSVWLSADEVRITSTAVPAPDTTFRDQAAIAALQGFIARDGQMQLQYMADDMKVLFDYAEALAAERRKRSA